MPDAAPLQAWDTITFDCYGTLVDWETGIANAFRDAGRTAGLDLDDPT